MGQPPGSMEQISLDEPRRDHDCGCSLSQPPYECEDEAHALILYGPCPASALTEGVHAGSTITERRRLTLPWHPR